MSKRLRNAKRLELLVWLVGGCGALGIATWAFRPLGVGYGAGQSNMSSADQQLASASDARSQQDQKRAERESLDLAGFQKLLWPEGVGKSREATTLEVSATTSSRPLVELIGIVDHEGSRLAALYEPIEGRLLLLRHGELLGGYGLEIGHEQVALVRGAERHELLLESR